MNFIDNLIYLLEDIEITVLAYADDVALISKRREAMKDGLKILKKWIEKYRVNINIYPKGSKTAAFTDAFILQMWKYHVWPTLSVWGFNLMRMELSKKNF